MAEAADMKMIYKMNRRLCVTAAYWGAGFQGWQIQKSGRTVQGELEKALKKLLKEPVRIVGSGRTDSSVNAREQCAHFETGNVSIPPERFVPALNSMLPKDVRILSCREVDGSFHARYSALSREYRFYVLPGSDLESSGSLYAWPCLKLKRQPDLKMLNSYAQYIPGTKNFTSFTAAGDASKSKVRHMYSAVWYPEGKFLVFRILGNAFLWKMVRSLVGTMLDLEWKKAPPKEMLRIFMAEDRRLAGITAPGDGLFLWKVNYE